MSGPRTALLASAGLFVPCWREAIVSLARPRAWLLLLPLLGVEWAVLAALHAFPHGPGGGAVVSLLRAAGGEVALHYPHGYAVLPSVFGWIDLGLLFVVGTACGVAVVSALPGVFLPSGSPRDRGRGRSRVVAAWGVTLPSVLLVGGALVAADRVDAIAGPGLAWLAPALRSGAFVSMTLLAGALPAVVLGRLAPLPAIGRGIVLASRSPWSTAGFVAGWWALTLPTRSWLAGAEARFGALPPEHTTLVLAVQTGLGLLGLYLFLANTTRLYLHFHGTDGESAS